MSQPALATQFTLLDHPQWLTPVLDFITEIGIPWHLTDLPDHTFLPGISIDAGHLHLDPTRLKHIGDVLHEAGHIAVALPADRPLLSGDVGATLGENMSPEMAVLPWTYAAALHLGMELPVLFHPEGYKGDSEWLHEHLTRPDGLGLPLMEWMGFCTRSKNAERLGLPVYPQLARWLRA